MTTEQKFGIRSQGLPEFKMKIWRTLLNASLVLTLCLVVPAYAANKTPVEYKQVNAIALGSGERWDFVVFDPVSKRVYVAHGDHVTVVDVGKAKVIGQIGTFPGGTHGIAMSTATHQGYTDDGKAGTAIAFSLSSLKPLKTISAASDADAIIYEPVTQHIYVVNGDSGSLTVIDPKSNAAIATIDVGAGLEPGVADGKGALFINGVQNHEIVKINAKTNKIEAHWAMPTCEKPHGLAIDPESRRLFATCANKVLVVVNADNGANIATVPIGSFSDGAAFDPKRKLIFSSNGDGTLSVIRERDAQTFVSVATINTAPGARTMTIDPSTGRLFLVAAEIAKSEPPASPGGRPHLTYVPNSLKLLYFDPVN
jgi:YVTN family beta-propeller protein